MRSGSRAFLCASVIASMHCGGQRVAETSATVTSSGAEQHEAMASSERLTWTGIHWDEARGAGAFIAVPLPEGLARNETGCVGGSASDSPPTGTVRLFDAVPGGSSSALYRERGTDRVWVVTMSTRLTMPQSGMATPSTRCFETDVSLPAGTRRAGTIVVR